MPCESMYDGLGRRIGIVCTKGPRVGARKRCSTCGELGAPFLCDGCDRPLCHRSGCGMHDRRCDKDVCRACLRQVVGGCGAAAPESACCGPLLGTLCARHQVVFTGWLQLHGGAVTYARKELNQEQKRMLFRNWVRVHDLEASEIWARAVHE